MHGIPTTSNCKTVISWEYKHLILINIKIINYLISLANCYENYLGRYYYASFESHSIIPVAIKINVRNSNIKLIEIFVW